MDIYVVSINDVIQPKTDDAEPGSLAEFYDLGEARKRRDEIGHPMAKVMKVASEEETSSFGGQLKAIRRTYEEVP